MSVRSPLFSATALRPPARIATALITLAFIAACTSDNPGPTDLNVRAKGLLSPTWQDKAGQLVAQAKFNPILAGHTYPVLGVAQYLAVQRAEKASGITDAQVANSSDARRTRTETDRGAVAGASVVILNSVFKDLLKDKPQLLDDILTTQKNADPSEPRTMLLAFEAGEAIGRSTGAEIVARVALDLFGAANNAIEPAGASWISSTTPASKSAGGQLPGVTRWFAISKVDQFRPGAPPAPGSAEFIAALAEIKTMADTGNAEMSRIAGDWAMNAGTSTAAGFWLNRASQNIVEHGLSEREATHVFALVSATMFDAFISCWEAKLTYWLIRPWDADIRIKPLASMGTPPPNHPSYPSGHSCVSSSGAEVLSAFFPDKRAELDAMVTEAGLSRMYGGIHYRFDIVAGQQLGRALGKFTIAADAAGTSVLTAR